MADNGQFMSEEDAFSPKYTAIDVHPITGRPSPPPVGDITPVIPQYMQGSIDPSLQHDVDFINTRYQNTSAPRFSLMPLGLQSKALTSTQIFSTIKTSGLIPTVTPTTPTTDVESIGINKQTGTSYTLQPSDNDTLVTFNNNAGGAITLPSPGGIATSGSTTGGQVDGSVTAATFSPNVNLTLAPSASSDLMFTAFIGNAFPLGTPSGWTGLAGGGGDITFISKQTSGTAPTTIAATPGTQNWAACMAAFRSSGSTVITARGGTAGVFSTGTTIALTGLTAGNYLVFVLAGLDGNGGLSFGLSDTQANPWKLASGVDSGSFVSSGITVNEHVRIFSTPITSNGNCTVTMAFTRGGPGTNLSANVEIYEVSGLIATGPVSSLPPFWYTYIQNTSTGTFGIGSLSLIDGINQIIQLPPNTGTIIVYDGTDYFTERGIKQAAINFTDIQGLVSLSQGGTAADLSATGGLSKFVAQLAAGAAFTVVQPDWSDLAGVLNQKAVKYNGVTLAAAGISSIIGTNNRPTSTGNLAATNLAGVNLVGLHRISVYIVVSQAATVSSTLPDTQLIYTDQDSGVSITVAATPSDTGNTTSTFLQATFVLNAKTGTFVQFAIGQVTPYASSGATPMQYAYRVRDEFLG